MKYLWPLAVLFLSNLLTAQESENPLFSEVGHAISSQDSFLKICARQRSTVRERLGLDMVLPWHCHGIAMPCHCHCFAIALPWQGHDQVARATK